MMQRILGLRFCGSHIGLFMSAYLLCGAAISEELLIAVASNFSGPMAELVKRFEAQTGHDIQVAYGSSGRLFAQIRSGAPFQIFLSADQDKPARLVDLGLADPASRFTYASGELVLWSADSSREVVDSNALLSPDVQWIALANPRLAPYGTAAAEVLDELNLSAHLSGKIVQGENIAQTLQFVESGMPSLICGQISSVEPSRNPCWNKLGGSRSLYRPIRQDAVLLNRAIGCQVCSEFLSFLREDAQRSLISASGYRVD